jgi:hypothetical protein
MASCAYCDSFILFGGKTDSTGYYCSERCQKAGILLALGAQVPRQELERLANEVHHANCPRCGSLGPVDVHKAHQVWSAIFLTSWSSKPELSCKSCATRRQLSAILFSGLFGWWGLPWGLVMTPVQIARNLAAMAGGPKPGEPSALLQKFVRLQAGARLAQTPARSSRPPPLPATLTPPPVPRTAEQPLTSGLSAPGDERYMPRA